jgi:lipopolysaccharide transport system permease protein
VSAASQLRDSRELLINLTMREVRGKYKRTALGQFWSLLNPLAMMLIFTVVFGQLVRVSIPVGNPSGLHLFALWLVCALLPWNFFNNAISAGMGSLVGNANLLKKVYFPRDVLVIATVLSWDVSFLFELVVAFAAVLVFGGMPLPWLPLVVLFVVLLTMFALGIGLALSVANVYFRDTQHLMGILMQMWFYATPIVYPISYVNKEAASIKHHHWDIFGHPLPVSFIYRLNPMERFTAVFRSLMYDNRWPTLTDSLYCVGAAVVSLAVGYYAFTRFSDRIAEEL